MPLDCIHEFAVHPTTAPPLMALWMSSIDGCRHTLESLNSACAPRSNFILVCHGEHVTPVSTSGNGAQTIQLQLHLKERWPGIASGLSCIRNRCSVLGGVEPSANGRADRRSFTCAMHFLVMNACLTLPHRRELGANSQRQPRAFFTRGRRETLNKLGGRRNLLHHKVMVQNSL